eukprot:4472550-Amphidinium_carterae.2
MAGLARAALQFLGLPSTGVTAHSCRSTGAVLSVLLRSGDREGADHGAIGRWSSEAIDQYLRDTPNVTVASVARDLFSAGSQIEA